jgi:hypothetical protein
MGLFLKASFLCWPWVALGTISLKEGNGIKAAIYFATAITWLGVIIHLHLEKEKKKVSSRDIRLSS